MTRAPWSVVWQITKICPLRCKHCFVYGGGEDPRRGALDLDLDGCKRIAKKLAAADVFQVAFVGGEPLALKWFEELLAFCTGCGIETVCSTSGELMTVSRALSLRSAGLSGIQISVDGARPATHDAIRGQGQFERALAAICACQSVGLDPQLAMVVTAQNVAEVPALMDLCKQSGISSLHLNGVIPTGRMSISDLDIPTRAAFRESILYAQSRGVREGIDVVVPCYIGTTKSDEPGNDVDIPDGRLRCGAGTTRGVVFEDGSMGVCEFMPQDRIGSLAYSSVEDLWTANNNPILEKWRHTDAIAGLCGACSGRKKCGYGCRANAYFGGGDFYGWDPMCIHLA